MRRSDRQRGYVTAETAVVIPSLVLLVGALLWCLGAVAVQLQCADAARAGARAVARGEPPGEVRAIVGSAAPSGAGLHVTRLDGLHLVRVEARALGPGPLAVRVSAEAVAHAEPS